MVYGLVLSVGVLLDQLTKYWASQSLSFFNATPVLGPITFQLVHNDGAAYGIFSSQRLFLITISLMVLVAGVVFRKYLATSEFSKWGMIFIGIGTIGNLIDRILYGYVIDFVNIQIIPVFNIADIAINIGALLFIIEYFWVLRSHEAR